MRKVKEGQQGLIGLLKGFARLFMTTDFDKQQPPEKGYIYLEEFMPNNSFDIRVVVIEEEKSAAEKRSVRENDFRASGSGKFSYDGIDEEVIEIAFEVAQKLSLQSVAFDFIYNESDMPLVVEISYGFGTDGISNSPGYWDSQLNWYDGSFKPQEWMLTDLLKSIKHQ